VPFDRQQLLAQQQKKAAAAAPHGTVKVAVHDTRLIQMVLGGIQEIGGFERDSWLE
jgi:hypothetical protein